MSPLSHSPGPMFRHGEEPVTAKERPENGKARQESSPRRALHPGLFPSRVAVPAPDQVSKPTDNRRRSNPVENAVDPFPICEGHGSPSREEKTNRLSVFRRARGHPLCSGCLRCRSAPSLASPTAWPRRRRSTRPLWLPRPGPAPFFPSGHPRLPLRPLERLSQGRGEGHRPVRAVSNVGHLRAQTGHSGRLPFRGRISTTSVGFSNPPFRRATLHEHEALDPFDMIGDRFDEYFAPVVDLFMTKNPIIIKTQMIYSDPWILEKRPFPFNTRSFSGSDEGDHRVGRSIFGSGSSIASSRGIDISAE